MKKHVIVVFAAAALSPLFADVMDKKAAVIKTVETAFAGTAEVACDDVKGWTFDVSASVDDGRDVVMVRLSRADDAAPPRFGVFFRVSGAGVQNVWTSNHQADGTHLWPRLWWGWKTPYHSELAHETPLVVGFNSAGVSPVAIACSEAMEHLVFGLYAEERSCDVIGRCEFFTKPTAARKAYVAKVMLDRRGRNWAETVTSCSRWVAKENGFKTAHAPEAAFDPLYSTWYAYLQDVHADELETEAKLAAEIGMKTMILDDGWQKAESKGFYTATGDWMPVKSRFPDMKAHVAKVHAAGLKYMLWLSVPYMGCEAKNYPRFKKMLLRDGDTGTLDPRFPEVREYLISTYERAVGEWGFDGLKLDFIDSFGLPANDPALKDDFAGRDFRSVPEALNRLMKDVRARLMKINPDVLLEFRQHYCGPAILQYGNMIRAADCPADPTANRRRICDLRLTSDTIAVHSDMLVWSGNETPEGAALPILNVLFSTIQYSMVLAKVSPEHRRVIASWLRFSQEHRAALLKGAFRPHHPELGYTWIEGESADERVIAVYADDVCARAGAADRPVFLVNATGKAGVLAELAAKPEKVEYFDVFGEKTGEAAPSNGLVRLAVPASGYARIGWPK
ncbi:MAG: alpha-galactosidase [Kiritimatiellae bacterium]|nr:alpha-galactosidase [Kiritimatiellia bacterium]